MHKLIMMDRTGRQSELFYDQHTSRLTDFHGFPAVDFSNSLWRKTIDPRNSYIPVSKENPGKKTRAVRRLKIQLGLGCNYSCAYCLQSHEIHNATASSTHDAELFVNNIHTWLPDPSTVQRVELWGGEPLLYWHKIKAMMPKLKELFPKAQFSMITNGSLLKTDVIQHLNNWNFAIGMSHDGPGQHIRGPDPLDDFETFFNIEYAINIMKSRFSFNAVLTPENHDPEKIIAWFKNKYPQANVTFEGVVHDYSNDPSAKFSEDQLRQFTIDLAEGLISGKYAKVPSFVQKLGDALTSLVNERSSNVLWQKCGMDMPDQLSVDLKGMVTTCQNVGSNGPHKIGDVRKFDDIALDTATHWSYREECVACPVLQMCKGSCMYQEGSGWVNSCNAEFAFNMAFFITALFILTGKRLVGFGNELLRPQI